MEPQRLSHITTLWTLVRQAHDDAGDEVRSAQQALLDRYGGAVRRYLRGALRDAEAADDLFQDFAYRFLHGDLRNADSGRGRFRDYVRGVLFHLVADYHNKRRRQPLPLEVDPAGRQDEAEALAEADRQFLENWRAELLARAWGGLSAFEQAAGQPYYTVLRFRADNPSLRSHEIAERLGPQMGRPLTAVGVRQVLHRARDKFAELLLYEVRQSLEDPTPERLEQELLDLGLHEYCRDALHRQQPGS
jgi:RNA polymerase sigma-70 factor (ECF subfamily)